MKTVNIHAAKTHLSKLLEEVEKGEEVVIARAGTPVAKLIRVAPPKLKPRKPGSMKGKIWISDNFNDPLPDDILRDFGIAP